MSHSSVDSGYGRSFAIGVGLNAGYIVVEIAFGLIFGSLALLADAGHNISDVLGLMLAWGASRLGSVKPTRHRTYGWRSSSILAALGNGLILLAAVGGIAWEAVRRILEPQPIAGLAMMAVAAVGIAINAGTAMLFFHGRHDDLNIRGAFLHMAADAAVSLGVVVAGGGVLLTGWTWIDPAASLVVAAVILWSTWDLLRKAFNLALHAVPDGIDPAAVEDYLRSCPGVLEIHDLHIWGMSTTETALSAHLVVPAMHNSDRLLKQISSQLREDFSIGHATIQIERSREEVDCQLAEPDSV